MAYGIECWNASGQKTLSVNRRLLRYHSFLSYSLERPNGIYLITVTGMAPDGTWAVFASDSGVEFVTGYASYTIVDGGIQLTLFTPTGANTSGTAYFLICRC